jgi:hypothetical protein
LQGAAKTSRKSTRRSIPICSIKYQEALSRQKLIRKHYKSVGSITISFEEDDLFFARFQGKRAYYIGYKLSLENSNLNASICVYLWMNVYIHIFISYRQFKMSSNAAISTKHVIIKNPVVFSKGESEKT